MIRKSDNINDRLLRVCCGNVWVYYIESYLLLMLICIYKLYLQRGIGMASTQVVNFRADLISYQKTKEILANEKITVSDVLNAALRKIANGTVDAKEFVYSDLKDTQYQVVFEDLKKEILAGHQEISEGKVTSLADVRKEFNLD